MIAKEKHAHSVLFFVSHRKGIRRGRLGYAVLVMENTEISQVTVIVNGEPRVLNGASGQIRTIATVGSHRRRAPAAAHQVPVLPGRHDVVQQARRGVPLPGDRAGGGEWGKGDSWG